MYVSKVYEYIKIYKHFVFYVPINSVSIIYKDNVNILNGK